MTVESLPIIERFEEGQQIRRSIKSVRSNIVEGYGRRRYRQDFIRFLTYAFASALETTDHLECLSETGSLDDANLYSSLHARLGELGRKLNKLFQAIEAGHQSVRELEAEYPSTCLDSESNIQDPTSSIQDPTPNIQDPKSKIQTPTSDSQDPASSIQHPASEESSDA